MNPARLTELLLLSLSLLSPDAKAVISRGVRSPRGVYDLPVQSDFFRRFLREPREIYLVARALLLLYAEPWRAAGCLQTPR